MQIPGSIPRLPLLAFLLAAMCSACAPPAPAPTPIPYPSLAAPSTPAWIGASDSPSDQGSQGSSFQHPVWPFTGLPATEGDAITRPSVAVKVDNAPAARPQDGLDQADVVVEELVEGGSTRFLAIFHSTYPDLVAPVRSGRRVDTEILPAFGEDLAMSGAADPTLVALRNGGLTLWLHGEVEGAFHRVKGRKAPHNLAVNVKKVADKVQATGHQLPPSPFRFDPTPPSPETTPGVSAVHQATLSLSQQTQVAWTWDGTGWTRSQGGDQPFTAKNVICIQAKVSKDGGVDSGGNATVHTDLTGSGHAMVLRDGMAIEGTWRKDSAREPLSLTDHNGVPIPLAPGQVWIELAPNTPTVQQAIAPRS